MKIGAWGLSRQRSLLKSVLAVILSVTWAFPPSVYAYTKHKSNPNDVVRKVSSAFYHGSSKNHLSWRHIQSIAKKHLPQKTARWVQREIRTLKKTPVPRVDFVKNKVIINNGKSSATLELLMKERVFFKLNGVPFTREEALHPEKTIKKYEKVIQGNWANTSVLFKKNWVYLLPLLIESAEAAGNSCWVGADTSKACGTTFRQSCNILKKCKTMCQRVEKGNPEKIKKCKKICQEPREVKIYENDKGEFRSSMVFYDSTYSIESQKELNGSVIKAKGYYEIQETIWGEESFDLDDFCFHPGDPSIEEFCRVRGDLRANRSGRSKKMFLEGKSFIVKNGTTSKKPTRYSCGGKKKETPVKREPFQAPKEEGMKNSTKIGIGVGVLAALVGGLFAAGVFDGDKDKKKKPPVPPNPNGKTPPPSTKPPEKPKDPPKPPPGGGGGTPPPTTPTPASAGGLNPYVPTTSGAGAK